MHFQVFEANNAVTCNFILSGECSLGKWSPAAATSAWGSVSSLKPISDLICPLRSPRGPGAGSTAGCTRRRGPTGMPSVSEIAAITGRDRCPGLSGVGTGGAQPISRQGALRTTGAGLHCHPGSLPGLSSCSVHPIASVAATHCLQWSPSVPWSERGTEPRLGWPGLLFTTAQSPAAPKVGPVYCGAQTAQSHGGCVLCWVLTERAQGCGRLKKCPNPKQRGMVQPQPNTPRCGEGGEKR